MRTPVLCALLPLATQAQAPSSVEFFEARIRPLLAEKCYACHGPKLASGSLRLDSRDAIRRGGNRGPAVVPGQLDLSLLVRAVSHRDADLKMPPSGRLTHEQIADLGAWIREGAVDPRDSAATPGPAKAASLWSLRPFRAHPPPPVSNSGWPRTWVDRFVLAKLEAARIAPSPESTRREWIRRVTFDLTGLPPGPAEIAAFLADRSPGAHERVVERLLGSHHYGERQARHWLDLARYAETDGHEFDREKPNAWRYRDYAIRAFNGDVPYDRFVREQIVGDLMPEPRLTPGREMLDSPLGTGFFALYEERNAADDLGEVRAEKLDNQIDTLGKTFLGLTVACARCHDHKFDPIPTRDYYALGGALSSKRVIQAELDAPEARKRQLQAIGEIAAIRARIDAAMPARRPPPKDTLAEALKKLEQASTDRDDARNPAAGWYSELLAALREPDHPLYPLARLARPRKPEAGLEFAARLGRLRQELAEWDAKAAAPDPAAIVFDTKGWRADGPAFRLAKPVPEAMGFLTSNTFRAERKYLHVRLSGAADATSGRQPGQLRVSLIGDGRDAVITADANGRASWKSSGMSKMFRELVYFELADRSRSGNLIVDKIVLSDSRDAPAEGRFIDSRVRALLDKDHGSLEQMAAAYAPLLESRPDLPARPADPEAVSAGLRKELADAAAKLEDPAFGLTGVEDEARNVRLHRSGSHKNLGDEVPRGFLSALNGKAFTQGSGRAELADAIADPANPLTARVFVNRVWKHHFGEGLVRTTDNFGSTGERPSHPELLDTLAARFVAAGWPIKQLHREIVLSAAYRQSSRAEPRADMADPENRLLHRMPVRRLEGEAVRDAILAVSGSLDRTSLGPSVPPHISEYQDGRGKPPTGPLDGNGRRTVYIGVRRNFLPPILTAFDYPPTVTTVGRRGSSTVPAQALILMNNDFVRKQAAQWSERAAALAPDPRARLEAMFLTAFGRPAEPGEIDDSLSFLEKQRAGYTENGSALAWADLAHSLFNSKEFLFIP